MPSFSGTAMYDGWKLYDMYTNCRHVLCNAYLLRNLIEIIDGTDQAWAQHIHKFLTQALMMKKHYKEILPHFFFRRTRNYNNYSFQFKQ